MIIAAHTAMRSLLALILLLLIGCSAKHEKIAEKAPEPRSLVTIETLLDSFNVEYKSVSSEAKKELVRKKYQHEIDNFLLDHYINHIPVHVDSVRVENLIITTRFHTNKNIVFRSSLTFRRPMPPKEDSLFSFMKGLKPSTDVSIDFAYTGICQLNYSSDSMKPPLIIFAYPLSFQMHRHH
jgi:hypothetical protein